MRSRRKKTAKREDGEKDKRNAKGARTQRQEDSAKKWNKKEAPQIVVLYLKFVMS